MSAVALTVILGLDTRIGLSACGTIATEARAASRDPRVKPEDDGTRGGEP